MGAWQRRVRGGEKTRPVRAGRHRHNARSVMAFLGLECGGSHRTRRHIVLQPQVLPGRRDHEDGAREGEELVCPAGVRVPVTAAADLQRLPVRRRTEDIILDLCNKP
uniref:Uncharacterized protein n=1 Tax=Arundo donax TaxID=35708 RepID=A0A0A8ZWC0_ARUDO